MDINLRSPIGGSLNKQKIIDVLDNFCGLFLIPKHLVHVSHGAAAVINGLRETTHDIDVAILGVNVWQRLQQSDVGLKVRHDICGLNPGADVIVLECLELHWCDEIDISADVKVHHGYFVSTEYQILVERIKLGREKDREEAEKLYPIYADRLPVYLKARYVQLNWETGVITHG